jgi:hypothetical protein
MMSQVAFYFLKVESRNKTTHLPFGFNGLSLKVFKKWFMWFSNIGTIIWTRISVYQVGQQVYKFNKCLAQYFWYLSIKKNGLQVGHIRYLVFLMPSKWEGRLVNMPSNHLSSPNVFEAMNNKLQLWQVTLPSSMSSFKWCNKFISKTSIMHSNSSVFQMG